MAARPYYITFGSGDPRNWTGLAPTFLIYNKYDGSAVSAPGITEPIAGSGIYQFTAAPSFSIAFLAFGNTSSLPSATAYVAGNIDPADANDEAITDLSTRMGTTASSFGSTSVDPDTLFGYLKRAQEFAEGSASYLKATGAWNIYSRGSSTLLASKALSNSAVGVTKV
jgi:hypothetical protein